MDIADFPFLSRGEFSEACHHLDRQYCRSALGPLRRRWRLRLCTVLNAAFFLDGSCTTYVQIKRPLDPDLDPADLSLDLGSFSISDHARDDSAVTADEAMVDHEESDAVRCDVVEHGPCLMLFSF